jgi:hypothetical protein
MYENVHKGVYVFFQIKNTININQYSYNLFNDLENIKYENLYFLNYNL